MFDIGFSELLLFGVIALVVLGPEKLPHAARTAGKWYAKIRRTVSTLQSEIEAELDLAETRQKMQEELEKIKQAEADMKREMAELRGSMKEFENAQNQNLDATLSKTPTSIDSVPENSTSADPISINNETYAYGVMPVAIDGSQSKDLPSDPLLDDVQVLPDESTTPISDNLTPININKSMTRPWAGMWFLLSRYDRERRIPPPPFRPNYQADTLLNEVVSTQINVNNPINQDTDNQDTDINEHSDYQNNKHAKNMTQIPDHQHTNPMPNEAKL